MELNDVCTSMKEAMESGASLQSTVRAYILEGMAASGALNVKMIAEQLCEAVATFRGEMGRIADTMEPGHERPAYIKKLNNIVNDVSRICREMLGYSIVNTKRKGGSYTYEARVPVTRSRIPHSVPAPDPDLRILFDPTKHMEIPTDFEEWLHKNKSNPLFAKDWPMILVKTPGGQFIIRDYLRGTNEKVGKVPTGEDLATLVSRLVEVVDPTELGKELLKHLPKKGE